MISWYIMSTIPSPNYYIFPLISPHISTNKIKKSHSSLNYLYIELTCNALTWHVWPSVVATTTFNRTHVLSCTDCGCYCCLTAVCVYAYACVCVRVCVCVCVWIFNVVWGAEYCAGCVVILLRIWLLHHTINFSFISALFFFFLLHHKETCRAFTAMSVPHHFHIYIFRRFHPESIQMIVYFPCVCLFFIQEDCVIFFLKLYSLKI